MKRVLLLDTCVVLWILQGHPRIVENRSLGNLLQKHERFYSSISVAEIEIKKSIGKLKIVPTYRDAISSSGIQELSFSVSEACLLGELPYYHRDPFDRMLIATAIQQNMTIVSSDSIFRKYPVDVLLA